MLGKSVLWIFWIFSMSFESFVICVKLLCVALDSVNLSMKAVKEFYQGSGILSVVKESQEMTGGR